MDSVLLEVDLTGEDLLVGDLEVLGSESLFEGFDGGVKINSVLAQLLSSSSDQFSDVDMDAFGGDLFSECSVVLRDELDVVFILKKSGDVADFAGVVSDSSRELLESGGVLLDEGRVGFSSILFGLSVEPVLGLSPLADLSVSLCSFTGQNSILSRSSPPDIREFLVVFSDDSLSLIVEELDLQVVGFGVVGLVLLDFGDQLFLDEISSIEPNLLSDLEMFESDFHGSRFPYSDLFFLSHIHFVEASDLVVMDFSTG